MRFKEFLLPINEKEKAMSDDTPWDQCWKDPEAHVLEITDDAGENFDGDPLALVKYSCNHMRFVLQSDVTAWRHEEYLRDDFNA